MRVAVALDDQVAAGALGAHLAAADQLREGRVLRIDLVDAELDEGEPAILRLSSATPAAAPATTRQVGPDHEIKRPFVRLVEDDRSGRHRVHDLAQATAPGDGIRRQGMQQQVAQRRAGRPRDGRRSCRHPRAAAGHRRCRAGCLGPRSARCKEAVGQPGARERQLAALGVQVKRAALWPLACRTFPLEQEHT